MTKISRPTPPLPPRPPVLLGRKARPEDKQMGGPPRAIVQTGAGGRPVLATDSLNLRAAEVALVRYAVKHAETLAAAAAMLGLSAPQLRSKARQLRVALPFTTQEGRRP